MGHDRRAADRAAAQRTRAEADQTAATRARAHEASVRSGEELTAEIRRLIPRVLDARAAHRYDGIRQVKRERKTLFGWKTETVGAYPVCNVDVISHGERVPREVLLASDGHLMPWDLDEIMKVLRSEPAGPRAEVFTTDGLHKIVSGLKALL